MRSLHSPSAMRTPRAMCCGQRPLCAAHGGYVSIKTRIICLKSTYISVQRIQIYLSKDTQTDNGFQTDSMRKRNMAAKRRHTAPAAQHTAPDPASAWPSFTIRHSSFTINLHEPGSTHTSRSPSWISCQGRPSVLSSSMKGSGSNCSTFQTPGLRQVPSISNRAAIMAGTPVV